MHYPVMTERQLAFRWKISLKTLRRSRLDAQYINAKKIVEATSLPAHLFTDRIERERKRIPHLLLVRNLRFSLEAILQWELANSVRSGVREPVTQIVEPEPEPVVPGRVPRWHELVREQDGEWCDSFR